MHASAHTRCLLFLSVYHVWSYISVRTKHRTELTVNRITGLLENRYNFGCSFLLPELRENSINRTEFPVKTECPGLYGTEENVISCGSSITVSMNIGCRYIFLFETITNTKFEIPDTQVCTGLFLCFWLSSK
jgi:hypothetical protein